MKAPDYSVMGRGALIRHCKQLRAVLEEAEPYKWALEKDMALIEAWEKSAKQALNSATVE